MIVATVCAQECQLAVQYGVQGTHFCQPQCSVLKHMAQDFEERALAMMRAKRIAGQPIRDDNNCDLTREALFWRKPNGDYGVEAFNQAWAGYVWGYEAGSKP